MFRLNMLKNNLTDLPTLYIKILKGFTPIRKNQKNLSVFAVQTKNREIREIRAKKKENKPSLTPTHS
jgi:hypothetical protein